MRPTTVEEVRLFRRTVDERERLAREWSQAFGVRVLPVSSAADAVSDADIVITATRSAEPVIQATWLKPGAHVNCLGPKYRGRTEIGLDLARRADILVCDFPEQYRSEADFILHGTPDLDRLADLAAWVASGVQRPPGSTSVFLSHGLAGTEVAVAAAMARRAQEQGIGYTLSSPS